MAPFYSPAYGRTFALCWVALMGLIMLGIAVGSNDNRFVRGLAAVLGVTMIVGSAILTLGGSW